MLVFLASPSPADHGVLSPVANPSGQPHPDNPYLRKGNVGPVADRGHPIVRMGTISPISPRQADDVPVRVPTLWIVWLELLLHDRNLGWLFLRDWSVHERELQARDSRTGVLDQSLGHGVKHHKRCAIQEKTLAADRQNLTLTRETVAHEMPCVGVLAGGDRMAELLQELQKRLLAFADTPPQRRELRRWGCPCGDRSTTNLNQTRDRPTSS